MKLSVLIPCKDRTRYLPQSIGSVLRGLGELPASWTSEIIVGDNDSAVPIATAVHAIDQDIRVRRHLRDLGIFGNMNALIAASDGDWIHVVHDDDWILPGFYRRFVAAITAAPQAEVVSICATTVDEATGEMKDNQSRVNRSGLVQKAELFRQLQFANPCAIVGMLISRRAYARVGPYREDLSHAADWDMWKRLALRLPWYWCTEHLACFRVHADSATARYQADGTVARDIRKAILNTAVDVHASTREAYEAGSLSWAGRMLREAEQQLADGNPSLAATTAGEAVKIIELFHYPAGDPG